MTDRKLPIYLDYQSTTPVDPAVVEAMLPYFTDQYGNAHSSNHAFGWTAAEAVATARARLARTIGAQPEEIIFTSGATESINIAMVGVVGGANTKTPHIVSVKTEHKAALSTLSRLEQQGCEVTLLDVDEQGLIRKSQIEHAITPNTVLVNVMAVNNEIGVVQPVKEIAALCADRDVPFHTDLAQAVGRLPLHVGRSRIAMASLSAHKFYGPKGIGALYCRRDLQQRISPLLSGGGQEQGLRSGTLPVPLVVGMGVASELAAKRRVAESKRLLTLRDAFLDALRAHVPDLIVHGSLEHRVPGNLSIAFPGVDADALLGLIPDIAVSLGSACTSAAPEPSHVLVALGIPYEIANSSLRIGFGHPTSEDDALYAAGRIGSAVRELHAAA